LKVVLEVAAGLRIVLSEVEPEVMLKQVLESNPSGGNVILATGPEGGWTGAELDLFTQAAWVSASLGSTILRAETAATAALSVAVASIPT
jgi:16S rRNA (uracil1498-N3)-methyltransferase